MNELRHLLLLLLPLSWFRNAALSYVTFLVDIAAVSVFLYFVPALDPEALLLYYLAVFMLTSAGQPGDAVRCRESGIAAYLSKPIRQAELREAICQVLSPESRQNKLGPVTRHSLREGKAAALRILLAEDNVVNQTLAKRLLEKRGHTVVVAGSGREALAALDEQNFDLVLMDVHMPDMDGLEATSAIREKEKATRTHLPIIAMTACAMKGDRELCLQAGMDGYVSKPVRPEELLEAVEASRSSLAHFEGVGESIETD